MRSAPTRRSRPGAAPARRTAARRRRRRRQGPRAPRRGTGGRVRTRFAGFAGRPVIRGVRGLRAVGVPRCPGRFGLGGGTQSAGPAALARHRLGGYGEFLVGEVVVDTLAAAGECEDQQDDRECHLRPDPEGVGEGLAVADIQFPALGGKLESLGPAVDGRPGERASVQGGLPARSCGVREPQDPARLPGLHRGVDADRARGDGLRLGTRVRRRTGDDRGPSDLPVDAPQLAAVQLAQPAQSGVASSTRLIARGAPSLTSR